MTWKRKDNKSIFPKQTIHHVLVHHFDILALPLCGRCEPKTGQLAVVWFFNRRAPGFFWIFGELLWVKLAMHAR